MLQGGAIYAKMHSYGIDVRTRQMAFGTGRVAWCSQCYKVRRFYMSNNNKLFGTYDNGILKRLCINCLYNKLVLVIPGLTDTQKQKTETNKGGK